MINTNNVKQTLLQVNQKKANRRLIISWTDLYPPLTGSGYSSESIAVLIVDHVDSPSQAVHPSQTLVMALITSLVVTIAQNED